MPFVSRTFIKIIFFFYREISFLIYSKDLNSTSYCVLRLRMLFMQSNATLGIYQTSQRVSKIVLSKSRTKIILGRKNIIPHFFNFLADCKKSLPERIAINAKVKRKLSANYRHRNDKQDRIARLLMNLGLSNSFSVCFASILLKNNLAGVEIYFLINNFFLWADFIRFKA